MKVIQIGLVGLGNVGSAAVSLFHQNQENFSKRLDCDIRLKWVCDRHPDKKLKRLSLSPETKITRDFHDLIQDPGLDLVIELIGGLKEAKTLVLGALRSGKHVITANKQLLSHDWEEIFATAAEKNRRVYFEASVAGGIPIIQTIQQELTANRIGKLTGILNGTTNYILTEMIHRRIPFSEALKQAQKIGLAERNPFLDLSGTDTVHKLSVLASLLTDRWIPPQKIYREGIEEIALEDILFINENLKHTVRLLGIFRMDSKNLEARVHPALVPLDHPLASVHGEYNAILLDASAAKDLLFYGKGAGPEPASSAVLGDLFTLCQEIAGSRRFIPYIHPKNSDSKPLRLLPMEETQNRYYLRLNAKDVPGVLAHATGALARCGISISQIYQNLPKDRLNQVPIVIVTHAARESRMRQALGRIKKIKAVSPRIVLFRLLNP